MIAGVTLASYGVEVKQDIRVLGVQLDSKLRFRSHLRQIEAKLAVR